MFRKIIYFICFVFFINFFLYSTTLLSVEAKGTSKDKKSRVRVVKMTKEDIKILGKELAQPGEFRIEEIKKALTALHYKENILLTWSKTKPVFGKKASAHFAPLIQRALQKVKPHYKVSFSIYSSNKKTSGDVFAKNDTLIFKLQIIDGIPYIDDFSLKTETEADVITNWKLIPGSKQQFYSHKGFLGIPKKEKTMVEAKLKRVKGKGKVIINTREKIITPEQPDKQRILERKLRYLKDLKKQNLITENAYKKKVEEILDQL
tara:strand:- start:4887 stop:5672 length:786 start_codon:yes stop_codon:yes gene_type:complete